MRRWILAAVATLMVTMTAQAQNFNDPKVMAQQAQELKETPAGPPGQFWVQSVGTGMVDTTKWRKPGPYNLCV